MMRAVISTHKLRMWAPPAISHSRLLNDISNPESPLRPQLGNRIYCIAAWNMTSIEFVIAVDIEVGKMLHCLVRRRGA